MPAFCLSTETAFPNLFHLFGGRPHPEELQSIISEMCYRDDPLSWYGTGSDPARRPLAEPRNETAIKAFLSCLLMGDCPSERCIEGIHQHGAPHAEYLQSLHDEGRGLPGLLPAEVVVLDRLEAALISLTGRNSGTPSLNTGVR